VSGHEGERLSAYLDGELPPVERLDVEAHLAACAVCTALLADLRAVDAWVPSLPADAPEGYFETFPSRVVARLGASRPRRLPTWTWAAAAALLLAIVAPLTLRRAAPVPVPRAATVPAAPRPASGGLEQKHESGAPSAPDASPVPAARAQPPFAPPPSAGRPVAPGGSAAAESPRPGQEASREEAMADAVPVLLPPSSARAPDGASTRANLKEAPAESREHQEAARLTTQSFAEPEPQSAPARPAPGAASASMSSVAHQDATAAGALSLAQPEAAFSRLEASRPRTAVQWRNLRDAWSSFAAAHPEDPRADEARVRAIEAAHEAWLVGHAAEDESAFERDARVYLERPDAVQKDRVRRLLPAAPQP
jgi:hypothetical protein